MGEINDLAIYFFCCRLPSGINGAKLSTSPQMTNLSLKAAEIKITMGNLLTAIKEPENV